MALSSIGAHKLRSSLTLVGVIAGVAAIIAVMTGVSVVQSEMEAELSVLSTRTFQIQKWPPGGQFGSNRDADWRKIMGWPPLLVEHADAIRERVKTVDLVGAELWQYNARVSYRGESTEPINMVCGGTPEYTDNNTHYVELGRNISNEDVRLARKVVVLGPAIANQLFPFSDPIGKTVKVDGRKFAVQGVFAERRSAMGGRFDNYILMPISTWKRAYGSREEDGRERGIFITVRAVSNEVLEDAKEETRAVLRATRGLSPRDEDNFFFRTSDGDIKLFNEATANLKRGAFVLGAIALVVAGIGIMNIMLVSVTERTKEIGIRKALGAKRSSILVQFLMEAVVLCNIGGLLGVAVGFGLGNLVTVFTEFSIHVPMEWAVRGLIFCTFVGVVFGMWPAVRASRMVPVEALRYE
jgi:putative ABC transport system permease protein